MAEYRCYFLDVDEHIVARKEFTAETSNRAVEMAEAFYVESRLRHAAVEVWTRSVFVYKRDDRRDPGSDHPAAPSRASASEKPTLNSSGNNSSLLSKLPARRERSP
jgi:hypothetical protein